MDVDYTRNAHARLFENDFLELTSKVHPAVPFVVYGPLVVGLLAWGLARGLTTPLAAAGFYVAGWIVWDIAEYAIHRGFFTGRAMALSPGRFTTSSTATTTATRMTPCGW